jgi:hypothetical protein
MLRRLRIAASFMSLLVCVTSIVLWIRSYYWLDQAQGCICGRYAIYAQSLDGHLLFGEYRDAEGDNLTWRIFSDFGPLRKILRIQHRALWQQLQYSAFGFGAMFVSNSGIEVMLPHWFVIALTGALAIFLKSKPRWRFRLIDLFVVTTCLGIVLGLFAVLDSATAKESQRRESRRQQRETPAATPTSARD